MQENNDIKSYLTNNAWLEVKYYIVEVMKDSLKSDIANANYYACLNDGSINSSVTEQEVVYLSFYAKALTWSSTLMSSWSRKLTQLE